MSQNRLVIYGASGFSGRLIVKEALARGLQPLIAGRNRDKLLTLARPNGLESCAASLGDDAATRRMLAGAKVLLNVAGPFRATAPTLARACLESGVHYLDIGGELATVEALAAMNRTAIERGCMILPSVGFDVVASDCMAAWVAQRLPEARELWIGLSGLNSISRGSAATVLDQAGQHIAVRRNGQLEQVRPGDLSRDFDFGHGLRRATAVAWVDVASAFRTTGIPNITVYYEETPIVRFGQRASRHAAPLLQAPGVKWMQGAALRFLAQGPTEIQRADGHATIVVQAEDARGRRQQVRLHTPEVYSFTASTSVAIADAVLGGRVVAGFQTPGRLFGPDYVLSFPGVRQDGIASHFD